jgi:hypothetical protein
VPIVVIHNRRSAHGGCGCHRDPISAAQVAGCFYCVPVFDVEEIEEWIDGGQMALCPHCGIDNVLPVIDGQPDVVFLWSCTATG